VELRRERTITPEDVGLLVRYRLAWCVVPLAIGVLLGGGTALAPRGELERVQIERVQSLDSASDSDSERGSESSSIDALTRALDREIAQRRSRIAMLRTSVSAFEATAGAPDASAIREQREVAAAELARLRSLERTLRAREATIQMELDSTQNQAEPGRLQAVARERELRQYLDELEVSGKASAARERGAARAELARLSRELGSESERRADPRGRLEEALARAEVESMRARTRARRQLERVAMLDAALDGIAQRIESRAEWGSRIAEIESEIASLQSVREASVARWARERIRLAESLRPQPLKRAIFGAGFGGALGALVGAVLMLWWHLRDPRVHTSRQLRAALNVPVLGIISETSVRSSSLDSEARGFRLVRAIRAGWRNLREG